MSGVFIRCKDCPLIWESDAGGSNHDLAAAPVDHALSGQAGHSYGLLAGCGGWGSKSESRGDPGPSGRSTRSARSSAAFTAVGLSACGVLD